MLQINIKNLKTNSKNEALKIQISSYAYMKLLNSGWLESPCWASAVFTVSMSDPNDASAVGQRRNKLPQRNKFTGNPSIFLTLNSKYIL
uniref:Uncharacterized protein n=1 Tax=Oryza brachyantha TaxID=4533 RepID=J3LS80_ORYBR